MLCPFAVWAGPLPMSNYAAGPSRKIGMCHHVIVGTLASADGEFHHDGAQLSAHFGVADGTDQYPDGHLVQWLDTNAICFAQADGNWPPSSFIAVETAGQPTTPWTAAQLATLGRLDAWASQQHGFPLQLCDHDGTGLTTHCHYPSGVADPAWGNHSCPGTPRLGQMPQVLALAQGQPVNKPPVTTPIVGDKDVASRVDFQVHTDANGDGYTDLPGVDAAKIISVIPNGQNPVTGGYHKVFQATPLNVNGAARIPLVTDAPNAVLDVHAFVTA